MEPLDTAAIYRAVLNGYCYWCETALRLATVNEWSEECPTCNRRFQARDGRFILSQPIPDAIERDVQIFLDLVTP